MIEIRHKLTGTVLLEVDADTLAGADLRGACLMGADLRGKGVSLLGQAHSLLPVLIAALPWAIPELLEHLLVGVVVAAAIVAVAARRERDGERIGNLTGADLRDAILIGADLGSAALSGADLRGAHLAGANLRWANLQGALYDTMTQWPIGFRLRWTGARLAPADPRREPVRADAREEDAEARPAEDREPGLA